MFDFVLYNMYFVFWMFCPASFWFFICSHEIQHCIHSNPQKQDQESLGPGHHWIKFSWNCLHCKMFLSFSDWMNIILKWQHLRWSSLNYKMKICFQQKQEGERWNRFTFCVFCILSKIFRSWNRISPLLKRLVTPGKWILHGENLFSSCFFFHFHVSLLSNKTYTCSLSEPCDWENSRGYFWLLQIW